MRTLIEQIAKFGVVGVIALIIDMAVMNALIICVHMPSVPAGFISFIISLIFNFLLSIRFVFHVRENMPRWKQALVFLFTAVIGLIMNEIILWLAVIPGNPMIGSNAYILQTNIGKMISVVIVAIWNFIARKKLLE